MTIPGRVAGKGQHNVYGLLALLREYERNERRFRIESPVQILMSAEAGRGVKMDEKKTVLCGANSYEMKYYFNEQFNSIPESIKEELHILCVLFTEEVGGVFTIAFEEDGNVVLETNADDDDIYYDEISSGLMISEVRRKRRELFEALSLYYKVFILKEDVSEYLE